MSTSFPATLLAPLLTLMSSGGSELAYTICGHLKILIARNPEVYQDSFKNFYCRYCCCSQDLFEKNRNGTSSFFCINRFNDPACVKVLKLEALTLLANPSNYSEIMSELAE